MGLGIHTQQLLQNPVNKPVNLKRPAGRFGNFRDDFQVMLQPDNRSRIIHLRKRLSSLPS